MPRNRPDKTALDPQAEKRANRMLRTAFLAYLFVEVTRIQDMIPPLRAIFPGMLTLSVLLVCLARTPFKGRFNDPMVKLLIAFLVTICAGVVVVVNHFWLLECFKLVALYGLAYFVALPMVVKDAESRMFILRTLCICCALLAIWTLTHVGHGPGGYLEDENDAAVVLTVGACAAFFLARGEHRLWVWIGRVSLVLALAAVVGTNSRGGFLGLVATLMAMAYFSGHLIKVGTGLAVFGLIAYAALPSSYKGEIDSINDSSNGTRMERLYSWGLGWDMFLDNPVIGVGAGNYAWRVADYERNRPNPTGRPTLAGRASHSLPFTLIPELGLAGVVVFVSLLVRALSRCRRVIFSDDPAHAEWKMWAQASGAGLIGYLVGSTFVSTLDYPTLWFLFGMASAIPIFEVATKKMPARRGRLGARAQTAPASQSQLQSREERVAAARAKRRR